MVRIYVSTYAGCLTNHSVSDTTDEIDFNQIDRSAVAPEQG
jgi:hypothetical protein